MSTGRRTSGRRSNFEVYHGDAIVDESSETSCHQCFICGASFRRAAGLESHIDAHSREWDKAEKSTPRRSSPLTNRKSIRPQEPKPKRSPLAVSKKTDSTRTKLTTKTDSPIKSITTATISSTSGLKTTISITTTHVTASVEEAEVLKSSGKSKHKSSPRKRLSSSCDSKALSAKRRSLGIDSAKASKLLQETCTTSVDVQQENNEQVEDTHRDTSEKSASCDVIDQDTQVSDEPLAEPLSPEIIPEVTEPESPTERSGVALEPPQTTKSVEPSQVAKAVEPPQVTTNLEPSQVAKPVEASQLDKSVEPAQATKPVVTKQEVEDLKPMEEMARVEHPMFDIKPEMKEELSDDLEDCMPQDAASDNSFGGNDTPVSENRDDKLMANKPKRKRWRRKTLQFDLDESIYTHRCNVCERRFKNRGNLVQHHRAHGEGVPELPPEEDKPKPSRKSRAKPDPTLAITYPGFAYENAAMNNMFLYNPEQYLQFMQRFGYDPSTGMVNYGQLMAMYQAQHQQEMLKRKSASGSLEPGEVSSGVHASKINHTTAPSTSASSTRTKPSTSVFGYETAPEDLSVSQARNNKYTAMSHNRTQTSRSQNNASALPVKKDIRPCVNEKSDTVMNNFSSECVEDCSASKKQLTTADLFAPGSNCGSRKRSRKPDKTYKCMLVQGDKYRYRVTEEEAATGAGGKCNNSNKRGDNVKTNVSDTTKQSSGCDGVLDLCVRKGADDKQHHDGDVTNNINHTSPAGTASNHTGQDNHESHNRVHTGNYSSHTSQSASAASYNGSSSSSSSSQRCHTDKASQQHEHSIKNQGCVSRSQQNSSNGVESNGGGGSAERKDKASWQVIGDMAMLTDNDKSSQVSGAGVTGSGDARADPSQSQGGDCGGEYGCDQCTMKFMTVALLAEHRITFHQDPKVTGVSIKVDNKCYECEWCHKQFLDHTLLLIHMKIHTEEKPYKCTQCAKSFTSETNLHTHLQLHK